MNITDQLEQILPSLHFDLLRSIGEIAEEQGMKAYIVGGLVRDALHLEVNLDLDIVVEGHAPDLLREIIARYGGDIRIHRPFRTGTWLLDDAVWSRIAAELDWRNPINDLSHIDFVTARSETYDHPAALPTITPSDITDDLARRDFTINTLAVHLNPERLGDLIDNHNGQADLKSGKIRVLHDASFIDDPTRLFRAVRYAKRFGYRLDDHTISLIPDALPHVEALSGDRVRHEFERIFKEVSPRDTLWRLARLGILAAVHPELGFEKDYLRPFRDLHYALDDLKLENIPLDAAYYALLLSPTEADPAQEIHKRLMASRRLSDAADQLRWLGEEIDKLGEDASSSTIYHILKGESDSVLAALYALEESTHKSISDYVTRLRDIKIYTTGETLIARGLRPSAQFAIILRRLHDAWLDGELSSEAEEAALLDKLLDELEDQD